jgi:DnaK suppressor protein
LAIQADYGRFPLMRQVVGKERMKSVAKTASKKVKSVKKAAKRPAKAAKTVVVAERPAVKPQAVKAQTVKPQTIKAQTKPAPPPIAARKEPPPSNGRPLPLASVPTNGKPRKNQAGLSSRELEMFRALLLEKRRELVGDVSSMERDALGSSSGTNLSNLPLHMADMGTDNYEQEFTLGLMEKDRKLLKEINRALAKIQDGSYGTCEGTGLPISKVRLEAQPWARFSIEHARKIEHGLSGRFSGE